MPTESGGRNGQKINPFYTGSILVIRKRLRRVNRNTNNFASRHGDSDTTSNPNIKDNRHLGA
jgi:hypothetical protein